jgi:hypothetical protein
MLCKSHVPGGYGMVLAPRALYNPNTKEFNHTAANDGPGKAVFGAVNKTEPPYRLVVAVP